MENCDLKQRLAHMAGFSCAVMLMAGVSMTTSSCKDDELLTGTPSWLGSSIYEELEERGAFTQTLALINDPDLAESNYSELLRRTGSMTLFVADDAAWSRFLAKRGVSSVSELSKAEKKTLLKAAMIDNAYLIDLLGNKAGNPVTEDVCMRHATRQSYEDSITVLYSSNMPEQATYRDHYVDHWASVRSKESIKLIDGYRWNNASFRDEPPMMYLLPRFMAQNSFTEKDVNLISQGTTSSMDRSFVNGTSIAKNEGRWADRDVESTGASKDFLQDITCQNGYIHILDEVPQPLDNMAEVIASKPQFSIFSKLLDRFSYPELVLASADESGNMEYFYSKRYFNSSLNHSLGDYTDDNGLPVTVDDRLSIDPGWNQYVLYNANNQYGMQEDAAAIFVPNDDKMRAYLNEGDGKVIGDKYGHDWDKVPDNLVAPFLNNCIQKSFRSTLPSKLAAMKNTAAEPMNMTIDDIKNCYLACNGIVYEVGNVFPAPEHEAVLFPALLRADENGDMKISNKIITYDPTALNTNIASEKAIRDAWKLHEFKAYLNSMSSTYSFLLPTDKSFGDMAEDPVERFYYIDPYSYTSGQKPQAFVFELPGPKDSSKDPIKATAYLLDEDGNITSKKATTTNQPKIAVVANRLYDIIDNCIIVHGQKGAETFRPSQTIYQAKTGSPVAVDFSGGKVASISGTMQLHTGQPITVEQEYDMTDKGNGVTYILNHLPQPTIITPDSLMNDVVKYPEYKTFSRLLKSSSFYSKTDVLDGHKAIGHPITLFGNYHYTVYIPQSATIDALVDDGKLPSEELIEGWETLYTALDDFVPTGTQEEKDAREAEIADLKTMVQDYQDKIYTAIDNFIRIHVQDGSVFLGGEQLSNVRYETSSVDMDLSRFRTLTVNNTGTAISISTKAVNAEGGEVEVSAHVIPGTDSNQMSRQYLFGSDRTIFSSSYVVTHLIDTPLYYNDNPKSANYQYLPIDAELGRFPTAVDKWPDWLPKSGSGAKKYAKKYRR